MTDSISTMGLNLSSTKNLSTGQTLLSKLSQQLTTGKYSSNLTDYTSSSAQKLLNFNSDVLQQKGFLSVIESISPRMDVYNSAMTAIEDTASEAFTSVSSASTYNATSNASLASQITGYMDQVSYYLNQQVGDRYIFSGSRYGQAPVGDITALPVPPTETSPYLATGDAVPAYDTDYDSLDPTALVPEANVREQAAIDTTKKLTYGVTSNEDGFQQLIMGLRFAYAATQDQANYETNMATARDLISSGLANTRATHTDSVNAYTTLIKAKTNISSKVTSLKNQVDTIEGVDMNEVAVKITTLQAQLEASYSAVSNLINLSILKYL
ncbi:MAG: flagellin [Bdellovibrionales bacterium]|jgi:flagellar hook-associated protein 3 FlgL